MSSEPRPSTAPMIERCLTLREVAMRTLPLRTAALAALVLLLGRHGEDLDQHHLLHLPALSEQAANYFRLIGMLVGGVVSSPQLVIDVQDGAAFLRYIRLAWTTRNAASCVTC